LSSPLTSKTMRPAAAPPIVTSKKTLGLDMLYVVYVRRIK
jgi:hypothetical protein